MAVRRRGRPAFQPKPAQRRRVELLAGEVSEEVIARLIGVAIETLKKHFADELQYGRARVLADQLDRLDRAAKKGNVAAAKALVARKDLSPEMPPPAPKLKPLGKKEEAALAAETAEEGTAWGHVLN